MQNTREEMQRMEGEREMLEKEDRTLSEVKTGKLKVGKEGGVVRRGL